MSTPSSRNLRRLEARQKRKRQAAARKIFAAHLARAFECFDDQTQPLWKRTVNGNRAFAEGLPLDDLPEALLEEVDRRFATANTILSKYPLKTWDDYQLMSEQDLLALQQLHRGMPIDT